MTNLRELESKKTPVTIAGLTNATMLALDSMGITPTRAGKAEQDAARARFGGACWRHESD